MENELIKENYEVLKEDIRKKLQETTESFVYIGYRLKQIQDSESYIEGGYASIFEFANQEYGLTKSVTSRFIAINTKYSVEGNSLELKPEFLNLGSSKLAEMLTLSDQDISLITTQTSVKEIREFKNFSKESYTIGGCDLAPKTIQEQSGSRTPLEKCIIDYFGQRDKRETFNRTISILKKMDQYEPGQESVAQVVIMSEIINPTGYQTHKKGMIFLFFYDAEQGIKYKVMGEAAPRSMSWMELKQIIADLYQSVISTDDPLEPWVAYYGEPEPAAAQIEEKEEDLEEPDKEEEEENEDEKVEEKVRETQQNRAVATVATDKKEHENPKKEEDKENVKRDEQEVNEDVSTDGDYGDRGETDSKEEQDREPDEPTEDEKQQDKEEQIQEVTDNPVISLLKEADRLYQDISIMDWGESYDYDEPIELDEIKAAKKNAEHLLAVLEQLENLMEGRE